jgi:hypothetical protein
VPDHAAPGALTTRALVIAALKDHNLTPDRNVLLTPGLREELMQLKTEQLLWEIVVSEKVRLWNARLCH